MTATTLIIFAGSFNPPTLAHRQAIATVQAALPGVPVTLLPAPRVAHKDPATLAPFADRMTMLQLLAMDGVTVSDFAAQVNSDQTMDVLDAWRAANPGQHVVWVMGADSFASLPQWHDWQRLMATTALFVLARADQVAEIHSLPPAQQFAAQEVTAPAALLQQMGWYVDTHFTAPFSATRVRDALARGEASPYLDGAVADFIATHGLYK